MTDHNEELIQALELRRTPSLAEILDEMIWCYYCGMPANSTDHVVPQSLLKDLADDPFILAKVKRRRRLEVPACRECNSLLGSNTYDTLAAKKRALKEKLEKKYSRFLDLPRWYDFETAELGPTLQQYVEQGQRIKRIVRARLRW